MRDRFTEVAGHLLASDDRTVVVLAVIGHGLFSEKGLVRRFPERIIDVGIREQTQIGIAGGLSLEGLKPIVSGYAPFLIERSYEQIKLDLTHQGTDAILVSVGASWDSAESGRSHLAPADVAIMATLPGWSIHVPGHPDELEMLLRHEHDVGSSAYIRTSVESNAQAHSTAPGMVSTLKRGSHGCPTILVVGPLADVTLDAIGDLDVVLLYSSTPAPLDREALRAAVTGTDVILIEPYLAGTSTARVMEALVDRPIRLHSHGVTESDLRRYGTPADHRKAHGLDAAGIRSFVMRAIAAPDEQL
jgi:transketolase